MALALLCGTVALAGPGGSRTVEAEQVKAAVIYKLTRFVEWPSGAPHSAPLLLAVIGTDEIAAELERLIEHDSGDHPGLELRQVSVPEPPLEADIVYIAHSATDRLCSVLRRLGDRPVLTIVDADHALPGGVVVGLRLERRRVRLLVDNRRAQRLGLRFDPRLLRLARLVEGQESCSADE